MPKIQASTVAEHRARQHRAILDAARAILAEGATDAPALAAVATRTGLARSSVYQYFASKEDLLRAVIEDAAPRWSSHVERAMSEASGPVDRVLAYVEANVALVANGEHAVFHGIAVVASAEDRATWTETMHVEQQRPLVAALADLGDPSPEATAELVQAILFTASRQVEAGADADTALAPARRILLPYLEGLAAPKLADVR